MSVEQQVAEAFRPLFDDRADEAHNEGAVLRVEQGLRDLLQQEQNDQAAQPIVAASQQQMRSLPALDHGNQRPRWVIVNSEHSTALWPAERLAALNTRQAVAIQQQPSQIGQSGGRVPMRPPMHQWGELPLAGVPVQGTRAEHIRTLHAEAAPSARFEAPLAAIEHSINVSLSLPKGFSSGTQHVPDGMLSFPDRHGPLPDADTARQLGFEQHVAEPRRADPAPVASVAREDRLPHVSDEHRDIIDKAIAQAEARQHQKSSTLSSYRSGLLRLANDLGERGQANDLKNHQSLVDHLATFFPEDTHIKTALNILRAYHEPGYSAAGRWPVTVPSKADEHLLEQLASTSGLVPRSLNHYSLSVRRFSAALERRGQTISGLDHDSRTELAKSLFPEDRYLRLALRRLRLSDEIAEARPSRRADEAPTNAGAVLRLEQGNRDALQRGQNDQAVPSVVAASQQQIRPLPDALDQGTHRPPQWVVPNNEHSTALWPAERLAAQNTPQAVTIQQQPSEIGNSGGRVPMQPPQRLGELPLAGVPVQRAGAEPIRSTQQAAPTARFDAPSAAVGPSINVSFTLPKGFSHGTQRVPGAMLSFLDSHGPLPDAGQAWQVGLEQQVAAPRRAGPAPAARRVRRGRHPSHRHVSDEHWNVIDKAIAQAAGSQQHYSENTLRTYTSALRRLANDLGERGQANDLTNHQSLVDHLATFFPDYPDMKTALNVLRAYHDPGYSVPGRPVPVPAKADAHLLEKAAGDSALGLGTRDKYVLALRRFSEALDSQGQTITGLDHDWRAEIAKSVYPDDRNLRYALKRLRKADSDGIAEAHQSLLDDRADEAPTSEGAVLRVEQGLRDALQQGQNDQVASSLFTNPGMPAGRDNLNTSMSDAFASFGHAGVQAAAPPVLAASQQQIRPLPDALDQGAHRPPQWVITNNEHSTALVRPPEGQTALNTPQAVAFQQQPSEIGNSGGRMPMQPPCTSWVNCRWLGYPFQAQRLNTSEGCSRRRPPQGLRRPSLLWRTLSTFRSPCPKASPMGPNASQRRCFLC
ncbi:hypothetical protein ACVDG8_012100 [Mesorhizobium sp. ORM8.1]